MIGAGPPSRYRVEWARGAEEISRWKRTVVISPPLAGIGESERRITAEIDPRSGAFLPHAVMRNAGWRRGLFTGLHVGMRSDGGLCAGGLRWDRQSNLNSKPNTPMASNNPSSSDKSSTQFPNQRSTPTQRSDQQERSIGSDKNQSAQPARSSGDESRRLAGSNQGSPDSGEAGQPRSNPNRSGENQGENQSGQWSGKPAAENPNRAHQPGGNRPRSETDEESDRQSSSQQRSPDRETNL
jgi:hypothetical protein